MMLSLRKNQLEAVTKSIENNFQNGIHFHATGTGKSITALQLLIEYNNINSQSNVLWLCEQKNILVEQFSTNTLRKKGYSKELNSRFHIFNYTINKQSDWYNSVNTAKFWGKPVLIIINRSFLVSKEKYKNIKLPINLIIHDECHSISNSTTMKFYDYIIEKYNSKCIGFTATPNTTIEPFTKIISKYSIYDAFKDNYVCPPLIKWYSCKEIIDYDDILEIFKSNISELPYKKIIIWCGMIELCYSIAELWYNEFGHQFTYCIDTSEEKNTNSKILLQLKIIINKNQILYYSVLQNTVKGVIYLI